MYFCSGSVAPHRNSFSTGLRGSKINLEVQPGLALIGNSSFTSFNRFTHSLAQTCWQARNPVEFPTEMLVLTGLLEKKKIKLHFSFFFFFFVLKSTRSKYMGPIYMYISRDTEIRQVRVSREIRGTCPHILVIGPLCHTPQSTTLVLVLLLDPILITFFFTLEPSQTARTCLSFSIIFFFCCRYFRRGTQGCLNGDCGGYKF